MALSDLVQITISLSAAQVTRAGFGKPLILANGDNTSSWGTQVYREYSSLSGLSADFATTTATYLMASRLLQQNPTVPLFGVGLRSASIEQQQWHISLASGVAGNSGIVLSGNVDGTAFTYTTNSSDGTTNDAIITGLETVIAALSISNLTVSVDSTGGSGSHTVKMVSASHIFHSAAVDSLTALVLAQDHGTSGSGGGSTLANIATDLNAINLQNATWYCILNPFNSLLDIMGIAAWAESNVRAFIAQTQDSNNATLAASGDTTSVMGKLANSAYTHTVSIYKKSTSDFADAAWAGACLPLQPGSETWAYHTLAGVPADTLTETQRNNIVGTIGTAGKNGNVYETIANVNVTEFGFVASGQFIDVIRFKDWLSANLQGDILQAFANASAAGQKIPFTDSGIGVIQAVVLARLKSGVTVGGLAPNPAPVVLVPTAASVNSTNKAARNLPLVSFTATLAGAIHTTQITGTITT